MESIGAVKRDDKKRLIWLCDVENVEARRQGKGALRVFGLIICNSNVSTLVFSVNRLSAANEILEELRAQEMNIQFRIDEMKAEITECLADFDFQMHAYVSIEVQDTGDCDGCMLEYFQGSFAQVVFLFT